jgi:alginate O-acetyltransferase complex protein AlgI
MAHLGILLAVFQKYQIEGRAFLALAVLAAGSLPLHYLAPYRWKKPLFLAVSIGGLLWVFGADVALIVLALSAVLIGVCYLPVRWSVRAAILATFALALAILRPESMLTTIPSTVWPVLASTFMFRMIIYMYELKHAKRGETLLDTLGYFFLLPNYCFMHFPVVDYRTLERGFLADDVHALQRRGLEMMLRGTIHLLCYRLIDQELLIPAAQVHGPWSLAGYLACNYLLYLQVSGQFHMACGMLHLFGYKLPETHHHYLLATGFTDYWRRINIYWKDFMVRIFFNPVVFRLKRWPQTAALAVGTMVVFVATWVLHAYQKFWLRGAWGLSVPDALFWGMLGGLVLINVQLDLRRSRIKSRPQAADPAGARIELGPLAIRIFKIAATFTTITLLWSLWNSPSLADWLDLLRRGLQVN